MPATTRETGKTSSQVWRKMGRRKSVRELQRQLQYAQAQAAYQPPAREENSTTQRQPKIGVTYNILSTLAPANGSFTIQASAAAITFFANNDLTTLGLLPVATAPAAPRGFQPAKVHAMVSDESPTLIRAKGSNRPYIRYGKGQRDSSNQYNYTAPISASTSTALDEKVRAVLNATKTKLGGRYGRAWYEAEIYPLSISG